MKWINWACVWLSEFEMDETRARELVADNFLFKLYSAKRLDNKCKHLKFNITMNIKKWKLHKNNAVWPVLSVTAMPV